MNAIINALRSDLKNMALKIFHSLSGVFALLQAYAVLGYMQSFLTKSEFKYFFFVSVTLAAGIVFAAVVGLTWLGVIAPWSGR